MGRVCVKCGNSIDNPDTFCTNCGQKNTRLMYCRDCGMLLNSKNECEICKTKEEAAVTNEGVIRYRPYSPRISFDSSTPKSIIVDILKGINGKLLCGCLVLGLSFILINFVITSDTFNMLGWITPKEHTSSYIIQNINSILEITPLEIRCADIYDYPKDDGIKDEENRSFIVGLRYNIMVTFTYRNKIEDNNKMQILLNYPEVKPRLLPGSQDISEKKAGEYPGIEIFDTNINWIRQSLKRDFAIGEMEQIIQRHLDKEVEKNKQKYIDMAKDNLIKHISKFSNNSETNFDIIIMGVNE